MKWHLISRDERECVTVEGDYQAAVDGALLRNWLILDLGWCPLCRFCSLGGVESDPSDRTGYLPRVGVGSRCRS